SRCPRHLLVRYRLVCRGCGIPPGLIRRRPMERDPAAISHGGQPGAPDTREADRIRAIYRSYDTQERWLRKRDPANPGFSQLQDERWRNLAEIIGAGLRGAVSPRVVDVGCGKGGDLAHIAELLPD